MARAIKLDANALHYYGDRSRSGAGDVDTPAALMTCEVALSSVTTQFEEEYAPEVRPEVPDETGCGVIEWMASGVALGGGKFAPYTRTVAGNSFLKSVPCKSIPARNNYPKALADAANQFAEHVQMPAKAIINVVNGKPRVEVDDQDLHTYRYQDLRAYSKQFKFPANPCGDKTFCEAGGSQAMAAFNRLEFSLERAAARAGNKPDVCRNQLKEVKAKAAWFETFHAEAVASHEWIAGATYKTKKGVKLSEKQLIAAFADNGKLAEDRLDEKYCNKPAKSPK